MYCRCLHGLTWFITRKAWDRQKSAHILTTFFKKICNILRVFSSSDAKLFMMKGGNERQVVLIRFGEGVLLRMYNVYMIRKGEVLNLKVMGGTGRHWKRNTLHLASAGKLDEWLEWGLSWQETDQVTIQLDCSLTAVLGTWKHLQPLLSLSANWYSGSFSCPFGGINLEKGDVFLPCFIDFSNM